MLTIAISMLGSLALRSPEATPSAPPMIVDHAYVAPAQKVVRRTARANSDFLQAIAIFESRNQIGIVNQYGMMGKYQFSPRTVAGLGFNVTQEEFLSNESLQDSVMRRYMRFNYNKLREVIRLHNGTYRDSVYITTAGILAGAHLMGAGGVLAYFYPDQYSHPVVDGNGVHITEYIRRFGNYSIRL